MCASAALALRKASVAAASAVTMLRSLARCDELDIELALEVALSGGLLYCRDFSVCVLPSAVAVLEVEERERAAAAASEGDNAEPG